MYFDVPIYVSDAFSIQSKDENEILTKFIYYFLKNKQEEIYNLAKGGAILHVYPSDVENIQIPIPPLSEQQRIVNFLDKLTELQTELQTEHKLRKEQYAYYRDLFLDFDNEDNPFYGEYENKILKNIVNKNKGIEITAKNMAKLDQKNLIDKNNLVKVFGGGKTVAWLRKNDVKRINTQPSIIVKSRGLIDFEFYDKPFSHKNEFWSYFSPNENKVNIKYIYYFLKNNNEFFIRKSKERGTIPQISLFVTDEFNVKLPKIEIQNKIVEILDKLEKYANDLNSGLPKLMELEKQRFDYYLNYLMNFKE